MIDKSGLFRVAPTGLIAICLMTAGCQSPKPPAYVKGPLIVAPSNCADFTQAIYFEPASAQVTAPAERLLTLAAARTRGCVVTGVAIVGLADAPGDTAANLAVSQRRADAVKASLHRRGFDQVEIQTTAAGETGAQTASGLNKPVRRRADVTFHLTSPSAK